MIPIGFYFSFLGGSLWQYAALMPTVDDNTRKDLRKKFRDCFGYSSLHQKSVEPSA